MKYLKRFNEAIGFQVKGDNRDEETFTPRSKFGYKDFSDKVNDKLINLIKKLKAMSERGESGEREVAKRKLEDISKKFGINIEKYLTDRGISKLGYKFSFEDDEYVDNIDRELQLIEENWKDQGESDPEFEDDILEIIKNFNDDLKIANVTVEDLQDPEKLNNYLINFKRYTLGNSHRNHKVSFNFSHIKNGKKIYFYDETFFWQKEKNETCYLIEDNKCIGVCKYHLKIINGKKYYIIGKIGVVSSKRRKGYGSDILKHIEDIHPGYSYYEDTLTTLKGDRFFHKVKGSKIYYKENEY